MSDLQSRSGSQLRLRAQLGRAATGLGVAAVMACFLVALLELTPEQWRWLLIGASVWVVAYGAITHFTLARIDGPIREALAAEAAGELDGERLRRGFASAVRFPVHGILFSLATWLGAGVVIPALMMLRYPDFPAAASVAVAHHHGLVGPVTTVGLAGGPLDVELIDGVAWLIGPARQVFEGRWSGGAR